MSKNVPETKYSINIICLSYEILAVMKSMFAFRIIISCDFKYISAIKHSYNLLSLINIYFNVKLYHIEFSAIWILNALKLSEALHK